MLKKVVDPGAMTGADSRWDDSFSYTDDGGTFERTLVATARRPSRTLVGHLSFSQESVPMMRSRVTMELVEARWSHSPSGAREMWPAIRAEVTELRICASEVASPGAAGAAGAALSGGAAAAAVPAAARRWL